MSLLQKQKEKYWGRICQARQELAEYEEGLDALVGTEVAAAVRQHIHPPWRHLLNGGKLPELPVEGQAALAEAQRLIKQETNITRNLHSPICCYGDYIAPPHVLSCYGIDWDDLRELEEDGVLPLRQVIRLLDIVLNEEMRFPTATELAARGNRDWDEANSIEEWCRLLKRKRRQLIRFLRTAVGLEEDLVRGFI
jgi:hypothetical protein